MIVNLKNKNVKKLSNIPEAISFVKNNLGLFQPDFTTLSKHYDEDYNFCFTWENIENLLSNYGNIYFNKKEYKTANGFRNAFKKRYGLC